MQEITSGRRFQKKLRSKKRKRRKKTLQNHAPAARPILPRGLRAAGPPARARRRRRGRRPGPRGRPGRRRRQRRGPQWQGEQWPGCVIVCASGCGQCERFCFGALFRDDVREDETLARVEKKRRERRGRKKETSERASEASSSLSFDRAHRHSSSTSSKVNLSPLAPSLSPLSPPPHPPTPPENPPPTPHRSTPSSARSSRW